MTKQERLEKQRKKLAEMTAHETELRAQGFRYLAGVDEVGRGPLAGPVYAACVVLPEDWDIPGIDDSKKLSEKKRNELDAVIRERALAWGIGIATAAEIDEIHILQATKQARRRAIRQAEQMLAERHGDWIDRLLIDALTLEDIDIPQEGIVHGDASSLSIAAASIVAKVARDAYMTEMEEQYPGYGFARNKGYGTAAHYEGLREFGFTPIHRRSFLGNFESKHGGTTGGTMAKKNYYAVRAGRNPGIYRTWDDCKAQVDGVRGAEYKGFGTKEEAENWLTGSAGGEVPEGIVSAYVDGSYDHSTRRYSCGAVLLANGEEICLRQCYDDADAAELRNVAGEIMGAKLAIGWCLDHDIPEVRIYHDYAGIGKWGDGEWKANLPMTQCYKRYVADARKHLKITFHKVAAHTGNKYNEMADQLAKGALEHPEGSSES
ncbi:MAG: ribonuclease HII [Mogibacterium sp.]|nr:ribonuclease HII [Mogibacterium sp.]